MKKIIEKYWKILLIFIGIPLVLIVLSFIYIRVGYKKPIFAISYSSNKIANGTRYDGILFSTIYCKDGNKKVKTRFTKYACSDNRPFVNGYYINEQGVSIEEKFYNKYLKEVSYFGNAKNDIDDFTQSEYDGIVKLIERAETGTLKSYGVYGKSEDGYALYVESETEKFYCLLGTLKDGDFILGDYVDGKCVIPENVTDYLKDENATLVDTLKEKMTCTINN
ncbi:MAG: hypothetical protein K2M17_01850 [Bacilli bacterium]|nr:hypothetical protein [Bacilli bacterium]